MQYKNLAERKFFHFIALTLGLFLLVLPVSVWAATTVGSNISTGGTLDVTGNSILGGTLGVTGNTTLSGTLGVTSNTTLGGTLGVTGNTTLSGTLGVTGASTFDTNTLYVDASSDKVGIGTTSTEFKLTIDNDGGIIATGTYGSGADLSTAGAGARMIWYPKKAAFRAGAVDSTDLTVWDNAYIGNYSVAFGLVNMAAGDYSVVAGGFNNFNYDDYSSILGGEENYIDGGAHSSIGGGYWHEIYQDYAFIGGGYYNTITGSSDSYSFIGGGIENNIVNTSRGTIAGGIENEINNGDYGFIGGGYQNTNYSGTTRITIAGGYSNYVIGSFGTICGGNNNEASSSAFVGGGANNTADGNYSTIGGGNTNTASGSSSTIPGGHTNTSSGDYSFAAGRRAKATQDGAFALADSTDADFTVGTANVFGGRFSGGYWFTGGDVGIGTNAPTDKLDINSDTIRIRTAKTPATAGATCDQGEIVWDTSYIYICTATDTWKRASIATW